MRQQIDTDSRGGKGSFWRQVAAVGQTALAVAAGVIVLIFLLPIVGIILAVVAGIALIAIVGFRWWVLRRLRRWQKDIMPRGKPGRPRKKIKVKVRQE